MEIINEPWARDLPRRKYTSPYGWKDNLLWVKNVVIGPSNKYSNLTSFIPRSTTLNEIVPEMKIAFLGDLLPHYKKEIKLGAKLKEFLKEIDYLVVNLEGVISHTSPGGNVIIHDHSIIDFLKELAP